MGAQATRLSDVKVKAAKPKEKDYILTDGDGLQMRVRANGSKLWNFNYIHPTTKKRINMGLGTFPEVSLAQARKRTVEARELVAQGLDPKAKRDEDRQTLRATTEDLAAKRSEILELAKSLFTSVNLDQAKAITSFLLVKGHPAYPVYSGFSFDIQAHGKRWILMGSSSD